MILTVSYNQHRQYKHAHHMNHPFTILSLISAFSLSAQAQRLAVLDCTAPAAPAAAASKVDIYLLSDPRCGFCRLALRDIGEWAGGKPVRLVALDISGDAEAVQQRELYQRYAVEVRDASPCPLKHKKFIPKIYAFELATGRRLLKLRGWASTDLRKVERKLSPWL
jgi:hypothetical protein